MATRGDWKLGANGCRGASWSKECLVELDGNFVARVPFVLDVSGLHGCRTLFFTVWHADKYTRVLLDIVQ